MRCNFGSLCRLFLRRDLLHSFVKLTCRNNIVPHEDVERPMSRNLHGRGCIHARTDEVAHGGAMEIVGDKALVLIPRLTCLFSESTPNACLDPLAPEVLYIE
jgi:hypothetical protein